MSEKPFIICGVPCDKVIKYETTFIELEEDVEYKIFFDKDTESWLMTRYKNDIQDKE